jgi:hypothetical protein
MNQKKCKALRARVAAGFDKAPLIMEYTPAYLKRIEQPALHYELPLTFKYPEESFQRVYRNLKKGKAVPTGESDL